MGKSTCSSHHRHHQPAIGSHCNCQRIIIINNQYIINKHREEHRATKVISKLPLPRQKAVAATEVVTPPTTMELGSPGVSTAPPVAAESVVAVPLTVSEVGNASLQYSDGVVSSGGRARETTRELVRAIVDEVVEVSINGVTG